MKRCSASQASTKPGVTPVVEAAGQLSEAVDVGDEAVVVLVARPRKGVHRRDGTPCPLARDWAAVAGPATRAPRGHRWGSHFVGPPSDMIQRTCH